MTVTTFASLQSAHSEKLVKILFAEHADGCRNRIVMGGLDKFLALWLRDADGASANQGSAADQIAMHLQGYGQKLPGERATAIQETLAALDAGKTELPASKVPQRCWDFQQAPTGRRQLAQTEPTLKSSVTVLSGIASTLAEKLGRVGVSTVEDLLFLFPRRHEDFSSLKTISQLHYGEEATVIAEIQEARNQKTPRGVRLFKIAVSDGTGFIEATWFNQPYLARALLPGSRVVLSGRLDEYMGRLAFQSPQWELWTKDLIHTGRLVPVYPSTEGLTQRRLRSLIRPAIGHWASRLVDALPASMRQRYDFVDLPTAIRQIHFPDDKDCLERARQRLCFEEFLLIQLGVLQQRLAWQQVPGRRLTVDQVSLSALVRALPFALTSAQQQVLADITADLQRSAPMSRLLQGDVGSGKTVVALLAMLLVVANNMQAVMMAPTEILAEQHHQTLVRILQGMSERLDAQDALAARLVSEANVGILIGSLNHAEKEERRRRIRAGEVNVVVGTNALIQEGVEFKDLGLAIVDEQHRFGVSQRAALRQKGYNPHVLVMSATPIPRTLALTMYGDLDLSVINELPPHRQKINTRWLKAEDRPKAYVFLRDQVVKGRQAFVICPLIEESEKIEAKAALTEYKRLQAQVFPDLRLGLLHGRMKGADKEEVMSSFQRGELDILVSTAVVEVGIDIPNATVMLVEGADRFGLAQLHQFRGRVGRGEHPSYCLLVAESPSAEGRQRLGVVATTHDGFVLAEEDLKMRGPGEFFGTRQTGLPNLKLASFSDMRVLEQARQAAQELLQEDPTLSLAEHQALALRVREFWGTQTDLS